MRNKVLPIYRVCIAIANEKVKKRIDKAQTKSGRIITRQTVARTLARLVEEYSLARFDSQSCGLVVVVVIVDEEEDRKREDVDDDDNEDEDDE